MDTTDSNKEEMTMIKQNKKAVSAVVGVALMVALVIGLAAVVWVVITSTVEQELGNVKTCSGNFDKVKLTSRYTCQSGDEFKFSISVGDIELDELVVTIYGNEQTVSLRIDGITGYAYAKNNAAEYTDETPLIVPVANSGKTYAVDLSATSEIGITKVDAIEIAPIIKGKQCDVSDSMQSVEPCELNA